MRLGGALRNLGRELADPLCVEPALSVEQIGRLPCVRPRVRIHSHTGLDSVGTRLGRFRARLGRLGALDLLAEHAHGLDSTTHLVGHTCDGPGVLGALRLQERHQLR